MRYFVPALDFGGDANAQAFIAAAGITDNTQKNAITKLVTDWKSIGMWNRTVAFYPFVGGSAASHKWNLVNPVDSDAAKRLVFTGGLTHSATGVLPNGTTGYADTFIDLNDDCPQYSLTFGYYSRTNVGPGAPDKSIFGCVGINQWFDYWNTNTVDISLGQFLRVGLSTTSFSNNTINAWNKLLGFSQCGWSSAAYYRDTTQVFTGPADVVGYWNIGTAADRKWRLFRSTLGYTNLECACAFVCYGVDQAKWNEIASVVNTFQTTLGRNV